MPPFDEVVLVERCELFAVPGTWDYAEANRGAIAAHWTSRLAGSPRLFNGVVHLLSSWEIAGGSFNGRFVRTDFASFLHWREHGHPASGVRDCFGSALVCSAEGHVLLGRQRPGDINSGLLYPPCGFIDPADVGADGRIDIDANISREIAEETGLDAAHLVWRPGFRIAFCGPLVSISREGRSPLSSQALRRAVLDYTAQDPEPELVDVVIVDSAARLGADTPRYAHLLIGSLFAEP